jgi:hypothetical protein
MILARTAKVIRPFVVQMVLSNYDASGLGTRSKHYEQTKHLRKVLEGTQVFLNFKKGELRIRLSTPPNAAPFDNQKGKADGFYNAFAALNYGAVHGATETESAGGKQQSIMGRRAKIALKKKLAGKMFRTRGKNRWQIAGAKVSAKRLERKLAAIKAISGKDVTVRKAYGFFELSSGQLAQAKYAAVSTIREEFARINRRSSGTQERKVS